MSFHKKLKDGFQTLCEKKIKVSADIEPNLENDLLQICLSFQKK